MRCRAHYTINWRHHALTQFGLSGHELRHGAWWYPDKTTCISADLHIPTAHVTASHVSSPAIPVPTVIPTKSTSYAINMTDSS